MYLCADYYRNKQKLLKTKQNQNEYARHYCCCGQEKTEDFNAPLMPVAGTMLICTDKSGTDGENL